MIPAEIDAPPVVCVSFEINVLLIFIRQGKGRGGAIGGEGLQVGDGIRYDCFQDGGLGWRLRTGFEFSGEWSTVRLLQVDDRLF